MKKADLETYKRKHQKTLTLDSGLEVTYREISPYALLKVQGELEIPVDSENIYSASVVDKLFEAFLISPKIPSEMTVGDFSKKDYEKLHSILIELVTFPEEELE